MEQCKGVLKNITFVKRVSLAPLLPRGEQRGEGRPDNRNGRCDVGTRRRHPTEKTCTSSTAVRDNQRVIKDPVFLPMLEYMLDDQERLTQMTGREAFVSKANVALKLLEMLTRNQDFFIGNRGDARTRRIADGSRNRDLLSGVKIHLDFSFFYTQSVR